MSTYFAHPGVFWLLPALLVVLLAALWSVRQKRRAIERLGQGGAVHKLLMVEPGSRQWRGWCLCLGLPLLLVGAAGPRWGWDVKPETSDGHDIVIVLDLSRSMLAEQPSRVERSLRALRNLADHVQKRGGQRLALVVFAARPHLLFPLTNDYDHFRAALAEIEAGDIPADIHPEATDPPPPSGTRIGAALELAVQTFDADGQRPRAMLLLSDGDDPAFEDKEWLEGVQAARALDIPIHTVGIGDPTRENLILIGDVPLQFEGKDVKTKLREAVLKDIAQRSGGSYVPAQTSNLPLGTLLPDILQRQTAAPADKPAAFPVQQQRQGWFLWPAFALLSATLLFPGRKRPVRVAVGSLTTRSNRTALAGSARPLATAFALIAFLQIGAFLADDDWIRQGNAAFAEGDLKAALDFYEKAEDGTNDPGLVAFNKAAVLYRMKRYREAELNYLRCLDDDRAPPARQAQALFSLGTSLLRQADEKDVATLDRAIDAFATCLTQPSLSPQLATDAQFNLETARILRFRAAPPPKSPNDPPNNSQNPPIPKEKKQDPRLNPAKQGDRPANGEQDKPGSKAGDDPKSAKTLASKLAPSGKLLVLPEGQSLQPLALEDAETILEQAAQRIREERRNAGQRPGVSARTKDW